jgi:hypothetical protein
LADNFFEGSNDVRSGWMFFSLLNRYFSTTLLYQILFLRQYVTSSFFKHNFLSILTEFGRFCWCGFGRFFFFLKGQTTSDRDEMFFFITKQILLHNCALPDFISNDFIFQAYFLKHFGWFWPVLLMRFYLIEWSKIKFENFFTFSMIFFISSMIFFFKKIKNHHFRTFFH